MTVRPARLLTQNRELKREGIWNWTLPAWKGQLADGREYDTCPNAGVCAQACYARSGTYLWPKVRAAHEAKLAYVLDDMAGWERQMLAEVGHPRHEGGWIRIHDAGDFFSSDYLAAWLRIMRARPKVNFYAYTKEISRFRRLVEPDPPGNFWWVYSYGGKQDGRLNDLVDHVADVFPDEDAIRAAGYSSQDGSDLLAVLGPKRVGIPQNNIPQFRKQLAGRTFREWQEQDRAERAAARA